MKNKKIYSFLFIIPFLIGCTPRLLFQVIPTFPKISYPQSSVHYLLGQPIATYSPTVSGDTPLSFSITPQLPTGLQFNDKTGVISGTPTAELNSTQFTVVTENGISSASTEFILNVHDFGNGSDGSLTVSAPNTIVNNVFSLLSPAGATAGQSSFVVTNAAGFSTGGGDVILVIQMQNYASSGILHWEFSKTASVSGSTISLTQPLSYSYSSSGGVNTENSQIAQVIRVPQYSDLTISSGGTLTTNAWNGVIGTGGVMTFYVNGTLHVQTGGSLVASGLGYRGGAGGFLVSPSGGIQAVSQSGESWPGMRQINMADIINSTDVIGGGASGSAIVSLAYSAIAGSQGLYGASASSIIQCKTFGANSSVLNSIVGSPYGKPYFTNEDGNGSSISLGSGGSGASVYATAGTCGNYAESGGIGGGIILVYAQNIKVDGQILAQGGTYNKSTGCLCNTGGPGSGGSIYLRSFNMELGSNLVDATGGIGSSEVGPASEGRIQLDYNQLSGQTFPQAGYVKTGVGIF